MGKRQVKGQKARRVTSHPLRFAGEDGSVSIYDGKGRYSEVLTQIYHDAAQPSTDSNARKIVYAMSLFLSEAERRGKGADAKAEEVREIVEYILHNRYDAVFTKTVSTFTKVHCGEESNPYTIKALVSGLRIGFERLIANGWRKGKNPLAAHRTVAKDMSVYREELKSTAIEEFRKSPICYYQTVGDVVVPMFVVEGSVLPDLMRKAGRAAKWRRREHAILGIMRDGGPRVCEAVEVPFCGWMACDFGSQIKVHNKWQGRKPRKVISLSAETEKTCNDYFMIERPLQDKRYSHFLLWAQKNRDASYTPYWYAIYMKEYNLDIDSEPLFLNDRGKAYLSKTFCRHAWTKARDKLKITATPHHVRRWYVNREILMIYEQFEDVRKRYGEMKKLIARMGWKRWKSVRPYDFEGHATNAVESYIASQLDDEISSDHEAGAEMVKKLGLAARMKEVT